MHGFILLVLGAGLVVSSAASAGPSVFVNSAKGSAFWNSEKNVGRVLEKQAGPVSVQSLSKFIADNRQYGPYTVCALSLVTKDSYVGVDKEVAAEMRQFDDKGWAIYRTAATTPDGRQVVGQSVLFESCDGDLKGAGVIVYDARTGEVLMFQELTDSERPYWFALIQQNKDKADSRLFSYSSCHECGESTAVHFDVTRKRVYKEYNGH